MAPATFVSSNEAVNGITPVRTVDIALGPSQSTMTGSDSAEKCCGFFFYVPGFSNSLSTVPHVGDVVDAGLKNLRPLYSTSKQIIDDALNSLSGATGSGKIVDNWLRAFTGKRHAAATLLTPTLYIYICLDPVQSGLNLESLDTVFIPTSQRLLVASRDLLKLNHFPSLHVSARSFKFLGTMITQ
jgi:hypothetical protein